MGLSLGEQLASRARKTQDRIPMLAEIDRTLWWRLPQPGLTPALLDELEGALDQVDGEQNLRALAITGPVDQYEKFFCLGMDINFLGECFANPDQVFLPFVSRYHELLHRIEESPVPVIAVVNGLARAGGFELLLACDLVYIADEAKIGDHHLASGLPPGAGAGVRAMNAIGPQRARELILTAGWLSAPEAVTMGLAARSFPRRSLENEVQAIVRKFHDTSRSALTATKRGMLSALPTRAACAQEFDLFAEFIRTDPLASEGYLAWIAKRKPSWP